MALLALITKLIWRTLAIQRTAGEALAGSARRNTVGRAIEILTFIARAEVIAGALSCTGAETYILGLGTDPCAEVSGSLTAQGARTGGAGSDPRLTLALTGVTIFTDRAHVVLGAGVTDHRDTSIVAVTHRVRIARGAIGTRGQRGAEGVDTG